MKAIVCEMCSSRDLVKQDGMYVCQSCGTKYSPDEARKLMVEVSGTVKLDNSQRVKNYYQLARRAKENGNAKDAERFYDLIRQENPNDWEACFYATYYAAEQTNIAGISQAALNVMNSATSALDMLSSRVTDQTSRAKVCSEMGRAIAELGTMMLNAAVNHYNQYRNASGAYTEMESRVSAVSLMLVTFGNAVESCLPQDIQTIRTAAVPLWDMALTATAKNGVPFTDDRRIYKDKIQQYAPDYKTSSGGCYVATAVYGSYDCPQVWTLRRYRDDTLAATWYGRAFIHTYYAISPTLVKWFGETEWFRKLWKPRLDRMVAHLHAEGVADTPYQDRNW